jgi:sugar phosphate isomerase/epimerase
MTVWKVVETFEQRQSFTWGRLEHDERLRKHAMDVWRANELRFPPNNMKDIEESIADARRSIEAIRARGGDVILVRPPSTGKLAELEESKFPRAQAWDRLLAETNTIGFHYADHAATRDLPCVEESHVSRENAAVFTRAYAEFVRTALEAKRRSSERF